MKTFPHAVPGLYPVADAFAGTVYSDVMSLKLYRLCTFYVFVGVGTTGTSTLTVEACNNVTPSLTSAIQFNYQQIAATDVHGAVTAATTTGYTTTAGSNRIEIIYAEASDLVAAGVEYGYVRLKAVEVADDPVLGGIMAVLSEPRYDVPSPGTQLT